MIYHDCNTQMSTQQRASGISALYQAYSASGNLDQIKVLLAAVERWGIEDAEIPRLIKTAAEAHNAWLNYQHFLAEANNEPS